MSLIIKCIKPTIHLLQLCQQVFPMVYTDQLITTESIGLFNGVFKDEAKWYILTSSNSDEILAFCTVGTTPTFSFIYNVGVLECYRNQGYGSQIIDAIVKLYTTHNLYLFVDKSNRVAIKLYRKFGFEYIDNAFVPSQGEICLVRSQIIDI